MKEIRGGWSNIIFYPFSLIALRLYLSEAYSDLRYGAEFFSTPPYIDFATMYFRLSLVYHGCNGFAFKLMRIILRLLIYLFPRIVLVLKFALYQLKVPNCSWWSNKAYKKNIQFFNNTSLITMNIPSNDIVSLSKQKLTNEMGLVSNIKSKVVKKHTRTALKSAL